MWDILSPKAIWEIKTKFSEICSSHCSCLDCQFDAFCHTTNDDDDDDEEFFE